MSNGANSGLNLTEGYERLAPGLPGAGLDWLTRLRDSELARHRDQGLPHVRLEAWRYTNLAGLGKLTPLTASGAEPDLHADDLPAPLLGEAQAGRLVFVNGVYRAELSAPPKPAQGLTIESLAEALARDGDALATHLTGGGAEAADSLLALNTALMRDGLMLRLAPGAVLDAPLEILHLNLGAPEGDAGQLRHQHPRHLLLLEAGAKASLVERHLGQTASAYLVNGHSEIGLGAGARLDLLRLQEEGPAGYHLSSCRARLAEEARLDAFTLTLGGRLQRNEVTVDLAGEGAHCELNGGYLLRGDGHCDNTTTIRHSSPHTTCREVFKGVLDDRARAVFQGRIVVEPGAVKADGRQLSKALLLSDEAEIDAKPELEIHADDVACSHGAAAGDLDHDALFYLRARGIPEPRARAMLVAAFLAEAVSLVPLAALQPILQARIGEWLDQN